LANKQYDGYPSLNYIYSGDIMTAKFLEHKTVDKTKKAKKSKKVAGVIKDEMVDPIRKFIKERNLEKLKKSLQKEYEKTARDRKKYVI
jgi:hypothetical protein